MKDKFRESIREKSIDELLEIVGSPEKWQPIAVRYASDELSLRNVDPIKIETAKYLSKKRERLNREMKAKEGYHICDFIFNPFSNLVEITLSWELKKDGYLRKARQQKVYRIVLSLLIITYLVFNLLVK